jgi:hypothetical protein
MNLRRQRYIRGYGLSRHKTKIAHATKVLQGARLKIP